MGNVKTVATSVALPGAPTHAEPVEESTYTAEGALAERVSYVDGAVVARISYRDDAGTDARIATSTTSDGMGYGIRTTRLQPREQPGAPMVAAADGRYPFVVARAFDSAGRLLNETIYPGSDPKTVGAPLSRLVYRYDQQGRLSEVGRFYGPPPSTPVGKEMLTYGANNRVVESMRYRRSNTMPTKRTYAYEDDARGNWTKRLETQLLDGRAIVTVTTRKITYF